MHGSIWTRFTLGTLHDETSVHSGDCWMAETMSRTKGLQVACRDQKARRWESCGGERREQPAAVRGPAPPLTPWTNHSVHLGVGGAWNDVWIASHSGEILRDSPSSLMSDSYKLKSVQRIKSSLQRAGALADRSEPEQMTHCAKSHSFFGSELSSHGISFFNTLLH